MDNPWAAYSDALLELLAEAEWQVRAMDQDFAYNTTRAERCASPADQRYYANRAAENTQHRAKFSLRASALRFAFEEAFGPVPPK